jgi:hypothetical protein
MTINRLITSLVQLAFGIPTLWLVREMYRDIKQNGLFGDLDNE